MKFSLAFPEYQIELETELRRQGLAFENLGGGNFLSADLAERPAWAQLWGEGAEILNFDSIGQAVRLLRERGRFWSGSSLQEHRRASLIQAQLPQRKSDLELDFLATVPNGNWGYWCLLDRHRLLAVPQTDSPFPSGLVKIKESKLPPSRAYQKLWELMTVERIRPQSGERVLELGASPGGWTWVLLELGCQVLAVDRSPLDPRLQNHPRLEFRSGDAFQLKPEAVGPVNWLFSDLICEPVKLFAAVQQWREAGVRNFVCTLKFKGKTDFDSLDLFRSIPGSRLRHLHANKHELTWSLVDPGRST